MKVWRKLLTLPVTCTTIIREHGNFYGSFSTKILGLFSPCIFRALQGISRDSICRHLYQARIVCTRIDALLFIFLSTNSLTRSTYQRDYPLSLPLFLSLLSLSLSFNFSRFNSFSLNTFASTLWQAEKSAPTLPKKAR